MIAWLHDVTVTLDGTTALRGITIDAAAGTTTAVVGGDGAGKTTTARTLVGLVEPSDGEVRRPARDAVGYQPEAAGTWPDMTVAENLAFVARAHRLGTDGARRTDELLEVTRLGAARDRLAADLSGGMRQKLAVAMAMLARPALLVLDEPTTGLDPLSRIELWRLVARGAGEGAAVLVTTAYLDEAERADHVVVLDRGEVLAGGTAASVRRGLDGTVRETTRRPADAPASWRRGAAWRSWWPDDDRGAGRAGGMQDAPADQVAERTDGRVVEADLTDVVTVAAMRRRVA